MRINSRVIDVQQEIESDPDEDPDDLDYPYGENSDEQMRRAVKASLEKKFKPNVEQDKFSGADEDSELQRVIQTSREEAHERNAMQESLLESEHAEHKKAL